MRYVSILRGINVGGQKKIKMADLKSLYESQGFENVVTYIQSGNVIFESDSHHPEDLKGVIEAAIEKQYAFQVPVIIRTAQEIEQIFTHCPFFEADDPDNGSKVLVTFLQAIATDENQQDVLQRVKVPETLAIVGREVYLYCPNGYGKSKLSNTFLEKKLKVSATTRNWKTVKKLYELSSL